MDNINIGIDLGGHKISAGVVDFSGETAQLLERATLPTPAGRKLDDVVGVFCGLISLWVAAGGSCNIGIGVPAFVDRDRRHAARMTNFPGCDGAALGDMLGTALKECGISAKIHLENDANCAALGEGAAGVAVGMKDFVVLTLGTGIGTGIVANGALLRGAHGMAGESGHMALSMDPLLCRCGCGGQGHLEELTSAEWVERRAKEYGLPGDFRVLWGMRGENRKVDAIINTMLETLARGVASLAATLDPEALILSGGMSRAEGLEDEIRERTQKYLSDPLRPVFVLKTSELGDAAAIIGAAM